MFGDTTYANLLSKKTHVTTPIDLERYFSASEVPYIINFTSCVGKRTTVSVGCVKRGTAHFTCLHCHYLF